MFKGEIEPADIKQGGLGDCYFLSSLAALAEHPDRIRRLFLRHERNEEGIYAVRHCKNGMRQMCMVDNYIPCKKGSPCFSRANGSETWVLVLEKAWAKIHKSYQRIKSGQTMNTIRDLTGAPGTVYKTNDEGTWDLILNGEAQDYIMCASVDNAVPEEEERLKTLGIVAKHAYTLLTAKEIGDLKLVKLRNPWGRFEWLGDWSDSSPLWTDEMKE